MAHSEYRIKDRFSDLKTSTRRMKCLSIEYTEAIHSGTPVLSKTVFFAGPSSHLEHGEQRGRLHPSILYYD